MKLLCSLLILCLTPLLCFADTTTIPLPEPALKGTMSLEEAIATRKTSRKYADTPLTLNQVGQLLWSAYGNLPTDGVSGATKKTVPSAKKTYPLEIYLVAGENGVKELPAGIYHYDPDKSAVELITPGDQRRPIAQACNGQSWMTTAPVFIVIGAVMERGASTSGPKRGVDFISMEAGYANQNVLLQARALNLSTNTVGGIKDQPLAEALKIDPIVRSLILVTVGKSAQ